MARPLHRIEIALYQLRAGGPLNRRSGRRVLDGALLRVGGGHACLQPWPEFGHGTLAGQLDALRAGGRTPLLERALACAEIDAAARREGRSLFEAAAPVLSHATLTDPAGQAAAAAAAGFEVWKLKAGAADGPLVAQLAAEFPGVRFRLDFNAAATAADVLASWRAWPDEVRARVEFIEDPCPAGAAAWAGLRDAGIPLAADNEDPPAGAADVLVSKPSWQDPQALAARRPGLPLVITSAMDHPLGQAFAAWVAGRQPAGRLHGLRTDHLFEPDAFSERLGSWRPQFHPPGGTGLGFDDLLAHLEWTAL